MFDTMTITKTIAGLCSALLIFLVGGWIADTVYLPHGEAPVAYVIDIGETETDGAAPTETEGPDLHALIAAADADAGAGLWRNCRACHSLEEGRNGLGPYLYGVVGRPIDTAQGFNYTGALEQLGETWTVDTLMRYLESPRNAAPGTSMNFIGVRNPNDRINLIAYIARESQ